MNIEESLNALVAAFNRGSLDVPANFFTPRTTFALNGRAYESILGGSPDEPLIRLLARGAAGYRTAAKALQYALQQPSVVLESLGEPDDSGLCTAQLRVKGELRNSREPFTTSVSLHLACDGRELGSVNAICAEGDVARIAAARQ